MLKLIIWIFNGVLLIILAMLILDTLLPLCIDHGCLAKLTTLLLKVFIFLSDNEIIKSLLGAFFGAAGGAFIMLRHEKNLRQKQDLASLNRALGIVASIATTLINIKRDYSIPQVKELNKIYDDWNTNNIKYQSSGKREELEISINEITHQITIPNLLSKELMEMLAKYSKAGPRTFLYVSQLDGFCFRLKDAVNQMNINIDKLMYDERPSNIKIPIYLGLAKEDGKTNDMIFSLIQVIEREIDNALCFTQKISKLLVGIGQGKVKMPKGVAEIEMKGEAKQYFPPDDYIKGYD